MKKYFLILVMLILCLTCAVSVAERKTVVKDSYYIGAMRVVNCKDYVSLRAAPDKTSSVLAKVPLDSIVLYCNNNVKQYAPGDHKKQAELFIRCEYEGQEGYILKKYLQKAPEFEPAETLQNSEIMSRDEIIGNGSIVFDWKEFNVSVLAAYEEIPDKKEGIWQYIRIGCFIDEDPIWGYTEAVKQNGQPVTLKAFMGGTEDEPMVYVYDEAYGLSMLELMDGTEVWTVLSNNCPLGDASVYTFGEYTGILYITGSDGPDPVAISSEGNILWRSEIDDPEVYGPQEIELKTNDIEIRYESGKTVLLEYNGELISVSDS